MLTTPSECQWREALPRGRERRDGATVDGTYGRTQFMVMCEGCVVIMRVTVSE